MPIFDFICNNCGTVDLDKLVKSHAQAVCCDQCNQPMVKGISAPNLLGMDAQGSSTKKQKT